MPRLAISWVFKMLAEFKFETRLALRESRVRVYSSTQEGYDLPILHVITDIGSTLPTFRIPLIPSAPAIKSFGRSISESKRLIYPFHPTLEAEVIRDDYFQSPNLGAFNR